MDTRISIARDHPDSATGRELIRQLDAELAGMYPPADQHGLHPNDAADPAFIFLVARWDGTPAGCGAVRPLSRGASEVKRMFVLPGFRGRGISRAVLEELERLSADRGDTVLCLETGTLQQAAIALYESAGYRRIPQFGEYIGGAFSVCYEKRLGGARGTG